jgi:hypothetical protein
MVALDSVKPALVLNNGTDAVTVPAVTVVLAGMFAGTSVTMYPAATVAEAVMVANVLPPCVISEQFVMFS